MGSTQPSGPQGPQEQMMMYRVEALERLVRDLVPNNVNELQIRRIEEAIERVVHEVSNVKAEVIALNEKIAQVTAGQDKLQIRVLIGILSAIFGIVLAFVSAYALHLIH